MKPDAWSTENNIGSGENPNRWREFDHASKADGKSSDWRSKWRSDASSSWKVSTLRDRRRSGSGKKMKMRVEAWKTAGVDMRIKEVLRCTPKKEYKKRGTFSCLRGSQWEAVWSSMILKKNGSLCALINNFKWLDQKEYAIQSEGDRTQNQHSEWTSVHDKIAHKEGNIKKL